jgi:beta-lactamase regulating signal transducer with metallopeptidase domain
MTHITQALTAALLHFIWQGLLVAFLLWAALTIMRKRSANARYAASCAALALLVLLPLITAAVAFKNSSGPTPPPLRQGAAVTMRAPQAATQPATIPAAGAPTWLEVVKPWALPVWSFGVLLFALRAVWGCRRIAALRRWARPADTSVIEMVTDLSRRLGLTRPVRVLSTAFADAPSVAGWLRPVILLPPATALGLTVEQLEAVLAHELAHIRRHDHLVNAAQILIETLLFYHPAVWWVSGQIRNERELCCDDLAVRSCGDALCYARALTRLERLRIVSPAMALGSTDGSLGYRVRRLMGAGAGEVGPSKLPGMIALALGLAVLALNVHWARGQQQEARTELGQLAVLSDRTEDAPGVTVDLRGGSVLHRDSVEYPEAALKAGVQGSVTAEATLDGTGNVVDARVLSGPMELRRAVVTSIFQWHFAQAATGTTRTVNVTFQTPPAQPSQAGGRVYTMNTRDGQKSWVMTYSPSELHRSLEEHLQNPEELALAVDAWKEASPEERKSVEQEVRELRSRIEEIQRTSGETESGQKRIKETETMLRELVARHQNGQASASENQFVRMIEIRGLPRSVGAELLAKLQIHVGDTLQPGSRDRVREAVRKFDEHLEVSFEPAEEGGTAIWISTPGGRFGRY